MFQKRIFCFFIFFFSTMLSFETSSKNSMRRCLLLPIKDNLGGALSSKVYVEIEKAFSNIYWCEYIKQRVLAEDYFEESQEDVKWNFKNLKKIAQDYDVGSLFFIEMDLSQGGLDLKIDVWGADGEDLYFKEREILANTSPILIKRKILDWLNVYRQQIPYDAIVDGVLGDEILVSFPLGTAPKIGSNFLVKRLKAKQKHPLLQKIVGWKTNTIAQGNIFNLSEGQAQGRISIYNQKTSVQPGDWIDFIPMEKVSVIEDKFTKTLQEPKGRLGQISLLAGLNSSRIDFSGDEKFLFKGNPLSFKFEGELWLTKNYFVSGVFGYSAGSLKDDKLGETDFFRNSFPNCWRVSIFDDRFFLGATG